MNNLKLKISENFSRAAARYDDSAHLQKDIARNLIKLAQPYIADDSTVLDIGSGTGFLACLLNRNIVQADIALGMCKQSSGFSPAVCADMEKLPFRKGSFDIIVSSSSVQWADIKTVLAEVYDVLGDNGYFIFSTFGSNTFSEVKEAFHMCNFEPKMNSFLKTSEVRSAISEAVMSIELYREEEHNIEFDSLPELLWSIKEIGAGVSTHGEGNLTRDKMHLVEDIYKRNFNSTTINANWEVQYYICKKCS